MSKRLGIGALVLIGVLVVVIIGQRWVIGHRDAALEALDAAAEAYRLDAAGAVVARQQSEVDLRSAIAENDALRQAAERVATLAPKSKPIGAVSHHGTAVDVPVPCQPPTPGGAVAASPTAPAPPLFRVRCDTDLLAARTDASNVVVDGETRLVREVPPPETVLGTDRWTHGTTVAWVAEPARVTTWSADALVGLTSRAQVEAAVVWHRASRIGWYARGAIRLDRTEAEVSGGLSLRLGRR